MSTLRVSNIESSDEFTDLTLKTSNAAGPTIVLSAANTNIYFNGIVPAINVATDTAIAAFNTANNAATTGKAIAMAIVFG